jgi:hypothetical protein
MVGVGRNILQSTPILLSLPNQSLTSNPLNIPLHYNPTHQIIMFVGSDDPMILLLEDVVNCNVPTTSNYKSLNVLLTILKNIRESPQ